MPMSDMQTTDGETMPVEAVLREELAVGDAVLGTIRPILGHLLANPGNSLFGDEIVARVRGMLDSLAGQYLRTIVRVNDTDAGLDVDEQMRADLVAGLSTIPALIGHAHARAMEYQLAEALRLRSEIDAILSPLLQNLVAEKSAEVSALAMQVLAAQARFTQQVRRMELPLEELPGDLFHTALLTMQAHYQADDQDRARRAEESLRSRFDEAAGREALLARLIGSLGRDAMDALRIDHAGVALFASALAIATNQDRDLAVLSTNERQLSRLALSLRAAGLNPQAVEQQFLFIHPDISLPDSFDRLRSDRAAALLAQGSGLPEG